MLVYYRGQDSFSGVGSVLPQYGPHGSISGCPAKQRVPLRTKPLCRSFLGIFKDIHMVMEHHYIYLQNSFIIQFVKLKLWTLATLPGTQAQFAVPTFGTTPTTGDLVPSAGLLRLKKKRERESEPTKQ